MQVPALQDLTLPLTGHVSTQCAARAWRALAGLTCLTRLSLSIPGFKIPESVPHPISLHWEPEDEALMFGPALAALTQLASLSLELSSAVADGRLPLFTNLKCLTGLTALSLVIDRDTVEDEGSFHSACARLAESVASLTRLQVALLSSPAV